MENLGKLSEILGIRGMRYHRIPGWKWVENAQFEVWWRGCDPFRVAGRRRAFRCPPTAAVALEVESPWGSDCSKRQGGQIVALPRGILNGFEGFVGWCSGRREVRRSGVSAFCVVTRMGAWYPCGMSNKPQQQYSARLAKALAVLCVRHTCLEDLHAGEPVVSKTGDFSDVKVISPDGEIPWNEVSRISQPEMKKLMKQIVNKLYTVLMSLEDEGAMDLVFRRGHDYTHHWDDPEFLPTFLKPLVPADEEAAVISQAPNNGRKS
jgi:hypothetical protein